MSKDKVISLENPDVLTGLLRSGARELIKKAVQSELAEFLSQYQDVTDSMGRPLVVRNGYLPEREIMTGIGPVDIKVPKTRDRGGQGIHFRSELLPPYIKRTKSVQTLLPWLYLKGISTGDFSEALARILHEKEVANPFQAYKIRLNVNSKKGTRRDRLYTHPTRFPRFQTS